MVVYDKNGRPLQPGNVVSDDSDTNWLISEIHTDNRAEDPCGYVVCEHNDHTEYFSIRYTDGGAMCFDVKLVREVL